MPREGSGAVVEAQGADLHIEPIVVDDPGPGEVLVRIEANGVCHSDLWAIANGNWGASWPMLVGHEAAGIVEAAGDGVASPGVGDRVVMSWAVPCGRCRSCTRGFPRRCAHEWVQPPRMRRARTGEVLTGTLSIGGLATHTVVHAAQAISIPEGTDPIRACLLGCGASTGIGAAVNTAKIGPGDRVAVIGLGGIGLAALQGARAAGAEVIVGVDLVAAKLDVARRLGATDTVDATATDAVAAVRRLTGGVDAAFEATGNASVVAQAVAMLDRGGVAVAIGVPAPGSRLDVAWGGDAEGAAYPNKATLLITDGGDPVPADDFPTWLGWDAEGTIDLGAMVSVVAPLDEPALAEAFRAMVAGEVVRTVICP